MKNRLLLIWVLILLIGVASAQATDIYQKDKELDLKLSCFNERTDSYCSSSSSCNITVFFPNASVIIDNSLMTNNGAYHNYTLNENQTSLVGTYFGSVLCIDGSSSTTQDFTFEVNPTGKEITSSQGVASMGLLMGMIFLAGIFAFFGFKFSESEKLFPIALFFMLISLLLGVYVMQLGYIYTRDILYPLSLEGMQFRIFLGVMWGLLGVAFLGMLILLVKTLKEFRVRKSIQKNSDGFDNNSR